MQLATDIKDKLYNVSNYDTIVRRQAVIWAFDPSDQSAQVVLSGSPDTILTNVKYLDTYFPVAGDTVWVDIRGTDPIIIGKLEGAWIPYTPTLTQFPTVTLASKYRRQGMTCTWQCEATCTAPLVSGTVMESTFPFAANSDFPHHVGVLFMFKVSSGARYSGACYINTGGTMRFTGNNVPVSATSPFAFAAGDGIIWNITYEVDDTA